MLRAWTALAGLAFTACSSLDDDLSDCGASYQMNYQLTLVTNISTELNTQLTTTVDMTMNASLRTLLKDIFRDIAHDVDLSFYDTHGDSLRLRHDQDIIDDNQTSYTIYLPMREYMHLAVANIAENNLVALENDEKCSTSRLVTPGLTGSNDTISSHTTGLFTAREPMEVLEGVNQAFYVHLDMANSAATLVIDTRGRSADSIKVFSTGFATGFEIQDSVYTFSAKPPMIRTTSVSDPASGQTAFCSVTFPSKEPATTAPSPTMPAAPKAPVETAAAPVETAAAPVETAAAATRTVIDTDEPFISEPDSKTLWEFRVYVTQPDGSVTESILGINEPLRAGQMKVLKCWLKEDGSIDTNFPEVSISVHMNWQQGGSYHHDI